MVMGSNPFGQDFLRDILESDPRLPFFAQVNQISRSQPQREFFTRRFTDIHNRFLGELGRQLGQGELPTLTFQDFLGGQDLQGMFSRASPRERGFNPGRLAPQARFIPPF